MPSRRRGAQMGRIGGDGAQRLRGGPEQDVVACRFVLVGNDGDLVGKREDHVEVRRLQKLGLSRRQPFGAGKRLAFWAMPIATGNGRRPLPVLWAKSVMGTRRSTVCRVWRRFARSNVDSRALCSP
jgi:hypothetical protein